MPNNGRPIAHRLIGTLVLIVGGAATGLLARTYLLPANDAAESPLVTQPNLTIAYSDSAYAEASVWFEGRLAPPIRDQAADLESDTVVVIAIRTDDLLSCEDLGRQVRHIASALGSNRRPTMAFLTEGTGVERLRQFMHGERIPTTPILTGDPTRVLETGGAISTPAALITTRSGTVINGVSHPQRFSNTRPRSFVQELNLDDPRFGATRR